MPADDALKVSGKTGEGVEELIERLIERIPQPKGDPEAPLQALIVDSWFDNYVGVVTLVRIFNGTLKVGDKIRVMSTGRAHLVDKLGRFTPKSVPAREFGPGDVGFMIAGIKEIDGAPVGDTITLEHKQATEPLPGFKQVQPRVFAGMFPIVSDDYDKFRDALSKLRLNDSALHYEPEVSGALGFGFRVGFLGLLHMDIVQERLEREYQIELITSAPTVIYEVKKTDGEVAFVDNPTKLPPVDRIDELREPIIIANILVPPDHVGGVLQLCNDKRGRQKKMLFLGNQVSLQYEMPLAEVVLDFFDRLKSTSRGYASFDYDFSHFEAAPLVKLDILINEEKIDALALIVHKDSAYERGRQLVDKMQELIPRQMFEVAVQAAIGSHIIARATVKALRKNVLAKCYGGDISRKKKLLEKQKEGKKRMKNIGPGGDPAGSVSRRAQGRKEVAHHVVLENPRSVGDPAELAGAAGHPGLAVRQVRARAASAQAAPNGEAEPGPHLHAHRRLAAALRDPRRGSSHRRQRGVRPGARDRGAVVLGGHPGRAVVRHSTAGSSRRAARSPRVRRPCRIRRCCAWPMPYCRYW